MLKRVTASQILFFLFLFLVLLIIFPIGCRKDDWGGKAWLENGVQVIENPEEGIWSGNEIELIQDLVIGHESNPQQSFYNIFAIKISSDGRIYILDAGNFRVVVFDKNGEFLFQFGARGSGPGEFNQAWDMALDAEGNVYVLDVSARRIVKFNPDGGYVDSIQLQFAPESLDLSENNLLLTEMRLATFGAFGRILDLETMRVKFKLELPYTYDPNVTAGGISLGEKYQFLRDGNIYLAVPFPYEIRRYSPTGELEMRILKEDSRVAAPYIRITGNSRFIMDKGMAGPCFLTNTGLINSCYWYISKDGERERQSAIDFYNDEGHYLGSIDLPNAQKLVAVDEQDDLYLVQPEPYEQVIRVRMHSKE
jgi:hypothetical protein